MQFFKNVLSTFVGILLFTVVAFFLLIASLIGIAAASDDKVVIKQNTVLKLDLNKNIAENAPEDALNNIFDQGNAVLGLVQIKQAIADAKTDGNIKGIFLQAEYPMAGWASLKEIRDDLISFKKSGKFIYAYGEVYSEKGYYLASMADKIFLNPAGGMEFNGLGTQYTFLKGALDKLGVEPLIFKVGTYKSAPEQFTRKDMSEASRQQSKELLQNINDFVFDEIAQSRNLTRIQLNQWADSLMVEDSQKALKNKLITHLAYFDEFESEVKTALKIDKEKTIDYVGVSKYLKTESRNDKSSDNIIAVIVGDGDIVSGNGGEGSIGSDKISELLTKARNNKKVKAVVLRINSPGGSSLASDIMWREIQLTKKVKPVIASMSDYAASGGYYMAMGADSIVAQPTTITGSIGIFAILFNSEKLMSEKLGITFDGVGTNTYANFPSLTHGMSDFEKTKIQLGVNRGYETFTAKAATGRRMKIEDLKNVASGRVWSGIEAKKNGLIDRFGGLNDAIKMAAKTAKIKGDDYEIAYWPKPKNFLESIFDKANTEVSMRMLQSQYGAFLPYVQQLKQLQKYEGMQMRMPFEMEIK